MTTNQYRMPQTAEDHNPPPPPRLFTVEQIGGGFPTQASGRVLPGDHPYYFRARHGAWTLHIGPNGDPTNLLDWTTDGLLIAEGPDPTHGCMSDEAVRRILSYHFGQEATP